jgi:hypothetical protein
MRVLFIGNSYTYFNDLPGLLTRLASAGSLQIDAESSVEGGMTLLGHLRSGKAVPLIRSGGWDVVVLQEQSTRPLDAPGLMDVAVRELAGEIDRAGARTALYLTWARRERPADQAALDAAYRRCARVVEATVVPVGPCWQRALQERPSAELYLEDGSHPAPMGTYLAACAFYATLFGRSPEGVAVREVLAGDGDGFVPLELPVEDVAFLQRVAWETGSSFEQNGGEEPDRGDWDRDGDVDAQVVRDVSLFRGLDPDEIDEVVARGTRVRIPAGTQVYAEGERGGAAYIVLDGELHVQTSDGFDGTFAPWSMGLALAAESRSLLGEAYRSTMTAVTDLSVFRFRDVEFEALAAEKPALAAVLRRNAALE